MSQARSSSFDRRHGLARRCRLATSPRATVYAVRSRRESPPPRRRGPSCLLTDADLLERIREVLKQSPFHGERMPDEMWAAEATVTLTLEEGTASVLVAVDH